MNKKRAILIGVCSALTLAVLMGSGAIQSAYSLIENSGSALTRRQTLNFVNGGCVDNSGANRTDCTIPAGGGAGSGGLTVFSGSAITLLGTQFLAVGGGAAISSTEASVEVQSPTAASVSNLSVQISAALGIGNSVVVTWRDGGSSQTLTCTISGVVATTCVDNTHTFNVVQGDEIDIQAVTTGTPAAVTIVIATQFGTLSNLNPTFTLPNAASTGTTVNTLTKMTGAPSTAVISATTDTGGVVGITTAGAGTTGTATITTAGKISCAFDGSTTAGDYVQISSSTAGNCHDTGAATYPTSGQVLGRTLSTNVGSGTYTLDLFPSEIKAASSGGGGFIQTLTAPVAASFTQQNFNTGSGVVTTQVNNVSPVTSIYLEQDDPNLTGASVALDKAKVAATFTETIAISTVTNAQNLGFLWLSNGGSPPTNIMFGYEGDGQFRILVFSDFGLTFVANPFNVTGMSLVPLGPLAWLRVQETVSSRIYSISPDGINFMKVFSESNTAHFTTSRYGWGARNNAAGNGAIATYSFTETNP